MGFSVKMNFDYKPQPNTFIDVSYDFAAPDFGKVPQNRYNNITSVGQVKEIVDEVGVKDKDIIGIVQFRMKSGESRDFKFKNVYSGMSGITRMFRESKQAFNSVNRVIQDLAKEKILRKQVSRDIHIALYKISKNAFAMYYSQDSLSERQVSQVQNEAVSLEKAYTSAYAQARKVPDFQKEFMKYDAQFRKLKNLKDLSYLRGKSQKQVLSDLDSIYNAFFSIDRQVGLVEELPKEDLDEINREARKWGYYPYV